MPASIRVIVNPASRSGATGRDWPAVEAKLRAALGELDVVHTRSPRDAEALAASAAREGVSHLVVAGGDGTLSEVASGLLGADLADRVRVGVLPLGSGGDLQRTLGVPRELDRAVGALRSDAPRRIDAGRVQFRDEDGVEREVHFLNVASFGISGLVDRYVNSARKRFGGEVAFAVGSLRAILRFRGVPARVRVDGELVLDGPVALVAAGNGRYFGAGMCVAPDAQLDDAALDVVCVRGQSVPSLLRKFPMLYKGTHVTDSTVSVHRGKRVDAEAEPGRLWLDIDGEALGTLPATIELLPGALELFGVPATPAR